MTPPPRSSDPDGFTGDSPFANIALGDIITLPDARSLSVRSAVRLPTPVGSMAGFVLLGELEVVLAVPSAVSSPVNVYLPVERFPVPTSHARTAAEGAARYWAPHLPALGGAMGEILYRVVEIRGSVDPIVIIYRGPEAVVFVRTSFTWGHDLSVLFMGRDAANEVEVTRHAADVLAVPAPRPAPAELYEVFTRR